MMDKKRGVNEKKCIYLNQEIKKTGGWEIKNRHKEKTTMFFRVALDLKIKIAV
ncbi:hypothetical protein [Draconibacterium halophilum]|uniref:Uncharacterized protein n=1 Tax=Draconibacterium halophilum TaxID=2706887 RepID=A0A6C0RI05_9BACT|nr:hypothetical protein [Draconibacterium halophilum]QIA09666.1 hypothetical protein G0Q07_19020 [Draconibacterium halophilum]